MGNSALPSSTKTPDLGALGIWSTELRSAPAAQARAAAAELESLGYKTLWIPGLSGQDAVPRAGELLDATQHVTVATGVIGIWSHDPVQLANDHRRLNEIYGGRLLTGIGASSPASAHSAGRTFPGALTAMRDYLDRLDAAATTIPKQQRLLAALGPKMTRLAAERAAGVHPFLVTPDHIAARRQLIGSGPLIAPHQAVVLERDPVLAREAARNGIGMFIGFPSYRANLQNLGFAEPDLVPGGSDRLIDAVVAWGGLDAVADRVRAHLDAGADHVALHVLPAQGGLSVADAWRQLAQLNPTPGRAGP